MDAPQKFPLQLLAASDEVRLDYFRNDVIVDHPTLTDALKRLDGAASPALDRRIHLLVGGTGVGKTAVLKKLVEKRIARQSAQMERRPELAPAIYVEIEPPDRGAFDFSSFYREGLVAMKASLIDRTVPVVERKTREGMLLTLATENARRNLGRDGLKLRFKNELVSRDVGVVAIDEAISFFKTGKVRTEKARLEVLKDQADKLKTFTNKTAATIILAGGFDFFDLALTTGQLARRCVIVPLEPYAMTAEGLVGFGTALAGLLSHMPIAHQLSGEAIASELFLQSLGCVGLLKEILSGAMLTALTEKSSLDINLVRKSYYSAAALKQMSEEMEDGMRAVREVTSLTVLASRADDDTGAAAASAAPPAVPLKPGETTPSHRTDAAAAW